MGAGGGSCEWKCNLCKKDTTFKGSYSRVKAHILHEGMVIEGCPHTLDLQVRDNFHKEHDDAQKIMFFLQYNDLVFKKLYIYIYIYIIFIYIYIYIFIYIYIS
jgi:hypothetical protein